MHALLREKTPQWACKTPIIIIITRVPQVRPDFLLLRTLSHSLVLWEHVVPSTAWVESHVPHTVHTHVHRAGSQSAPGIDYESMHQVSTRVRGEAWTTMPRRAMQCS